MKLYDGGRAPNPRRTRIFLAEKGITLPTEQVDLMAMAQTSPAYAAINPLKRVPALVLDDDHAHTLAEALPVWLGDRARLEALGRRARSVTVERYDWERVVDGLEAVCSEVTTR